MPNWADVVVKISRLYPITRQQTEMETCSEFETENELSILNTKFQKGNGKLWTFEYVMDTERNLTTFS